MAQGLIDPAKPKRQFDNIAAGTENSITGTQEFKERHQRRLGKVNAVEGRYQQSRDRQGAVPVSDL